MNLKISLKTENLIRNTLQNNQSTNTYFEPFGFLHRLIFTSRPNLGMHSGIHPSPHLNCYHQIIITRFNLAIFYFAPYKRLVWHYQQGNTDLIKRPTEVLDWEKSLSNLDVNKQFSVFNETIMHIFEKFFPHKTNVCNEKIIPGSINK